MVLYRCFSVWFINHVHLVIVYACMSQHVKGIFWWGPVWKRYLTCMKDMESLYFLSYRNRFRHPSNAIFMPRKWGPRRFRDTSVWLHNWVVLSNMFYFHPYLGKISNLANIFQMGGSTTNQTITLRPAISWPQKLAFESHDIGSPSGTAIFPWDSRLPFHLPAHPPSISTCCCLDPEFGKGNETFRKYDTLR